MAYNTDLYLLKNILQSNVVKVFTWSNIWPLHHDKPQTFLLSFLSFLSLTVKKTNKKKKEDQDKIEEDPETQLNVNLLWFFSPFKISYWSHSVTKSSFKNLLSLNSLECSPYKQTCYSSSWGPQLVSLWFRACA